jgi:hypothetical protein
MQVIRKISLIYTPLNGYRWVVLVETLVAARLVVEEAATAEAGLIILLDCDWGPARSSVPIYGHVALPSATQLSKRRPDGCRTVPISCFI